MVLCGIAVDGAAEPIEDIRLSVTIRFCIIIESLSLWFALPSSRVRSHSRSSCATVVVIGQWKQGGLNMHHSVSSSAS